MHLEEGRLLKGEYDIAHGQIKPYLRVALASMDLRLRAQLAIVIAGLHPPPLPE